MRGEANIQPGGRALVPDVASSADDHILIALQVDPTGIMMGRALSARSQWIALRCIDDLASVVAPPYARSRCDRSYV